MSGTDFQSEKKRFLFLNHWARYMGGAEFSLLDLITGFEGKGDIYLSTSESGALLDHLKQSSIRCVLHTCSPNLMNIKRNNLLLSALINFRSVFAYFKYILRIRKFILELQPHCIHANVPKSHITLFIMMYLGYTGIGFIHMREIFTRNSFAYLLYRFLFRSSRLSVIAISEAVKKSLPGNMQSTAEVIYNGVRIPSRTAAHSISYPIRFLYLGRVVPWKGCHLLIRAFSLLNNDLIRGKKVHLTITGATLYWNDHYRHKLITLINDLELSEIITLNDVTNQPYLELQQHHILCMASASEPFGRVAVEAHSCGLPVIGFNSGGLPEVVDNGKTGFLVPEGNINALTQVIEKLIHSPEQIPILGENGKKRVELLFNSDNQVPKLVNFIINRLNKIHRRKHGITLCF